MAVHSPNNRIVAHEKAQENNGDGQIYSHGHDPMPFEPVAIIGMAMRLPGRVRNENDFWNLLSGKQSGLCEVPKDRFNIHGFYDSFGHVGTIPINRGYFLEDVDIQQFDTTVFPIPKAELERLDPSQRQLLQVAYECFESAGISSWRGSSVGCYVGEFGEDWADVNAKEPQHKGGYRGTGFGDFAMSNRVSYEFDLRGPSMTVKTACSSSLVCLDLACLAIRNGECDSALPSMTSALTSRSDRDADEEEIPLITQIDWMPHSDFADLGSRFRRPAPRVMEWPLLEELTLLCMLDHDEGIETNGNTAEHLIKFSVWMQQQIENYKQGTNKFVDKNKRLEKKSAEQRLERIKEILAMLSSSPYAIFTKAIGKLFSVAPAIFSGETHPLHILLEDNVLAEFYDALSMDSADLLELLANTNPHMRILEVGAGTGGTTARVLRALTSSYGECLYSVYTYTDVSAGFIPAAKQRFANHEKIEYAVLNVAADPAEQGFQPGSYDLIIAANGFLQGWWLGAHDNRVNQPYISPERWTKELLHAGFSKPEVIVLDDSAPYHVNTGIIVTRESRNTSLLPVSLLCHSPNSPCVSEVHQCLESLDVAVNICHFGQELPSHNDIISLLDLEAPVLHEMTEQTFDTIKEYLSSHKAKILWVTPASQVGDVKDPRAAMVLGFARTVRNERSLPFFTIEVDETTTSAVATASAICRILQHAGSEQLNNREFIDPDYEYAIIKGEVLVPRLHRQTISKAFQSTQLGDDCETDDLMTDRHITMKMPGLLHTITWSKGESSRSPAEGDIVVETRAVGLNFRDVLIALGIIENGPSEMGFEGSGVVRAVGPGDSRFSVGDHVMYLGSGCFKTIHTVNAALCVKMDDSMTFEQGAALPCVYTTALMALVDKADLKCGQSVLIHAACGGVGLAAIQIAKMLGAQIYCTVGSDVKRNHLAENYGIPPSHIFNSRDSSFLPDVLRATDGRGVDVVLNSLSGDLLQASWQCVAEFGIMVEIGKRDFQRRATLAMAPFEANRTFTGLELRLVLQAYPHKAAALLERCVEWIREGRIRGPTVSNIFEAVQIQDALRTMQTARHIGKMVIKMPRDARDLDRPTMHTPSFQFRSDRTYLLVGGLGGLGRAMATWMVENGARSLVFLSRSSQKGPQTDGFVKELHSQGCQVLLVEGSVSNRADVQRAVDNEATASRALAGVINLAMVLRDVAFADMSFEDWNTAVKPKVRGTWHLHEAISDNKELEFFVLLSSCSGIVGQWGQANYAAANTFLDAFVHFRHGQGLVASVIDLGVMGDVGFVSQNHDLLENLGRMGMRILREQNLLDALVLALRASRPTQVATGQLGSQPGNTCMTYRSPGQVLLGLNTTVPISSPLSRVPWRRDARMSIHHNLEVLSNNGGKQTSPLRDSLRANLAPLTNNTDRTATIACALTAALANFLIKDENDIPLDRPLEHLGIDSLVAMEVRNWIRQQIGVELSTISIVQSPSLFHLAEDIRLRMGKTS
ncbi:polyketide synthase [Metarhizium robertsii ARSEF 23]|uniref:Polyketide synthase n=1 Tax=Metarhizium robertsii (strain ARSEF 23 / ATCC MYA-3075) TaxID=655844 RepID=E9FCN4_METRA|nr:polyketide synthase [Metarhizium robertsii ARSEF 23]EFY94490.2 polyketide synthase [Metarhizium robertsii ARSEF 23]